MSRWRTLAISQQKLVLYGLSALLRLSLAFAFPALPGFLTSRVEVSTPVTSFKRCTRLAHGKLFTAGWLTDETVQEGLYLYTHGVSPYDGGVFHQAPLLLSLFSALPDAQRWPFVIQALYVVVDILSADALSRILESGQAVSTPFYRSPRSNRVWSPIAVVASYLFNPFTVLTCLGRPTSVFQTYFVLLATAQACSGALMSSAFALALATHVSLHPALLLPPVSLLCGHALLQGQGKGKAGSRSLTNCLLRHWLAFGAFSALLLGTSYAMLGSWDFVPAVYGTRLLLPDLTPNIGLWWYFFIEMFDSFRSFFLGVFWLHIVAYSPGLTIRLSKQPLAAAVIMCGVIAIFQPYASIGDAGAWLAMLTVYGHVLELTRYMFPALSTLLYTALFGPAFHYLWIYAGSGNANFFYAITLVWSLGLVVLLADVLYAILRDEWELERPEMKGQESRQI